MDIPELDNNNRFVRVALEDRFVIPFSTEYCCRFFFCDYLMKTLVLKYFLLKSFWNFNTLLYPIQVRIAQFYYRSYYLLKFFMSIYKDEFLTNIIYQQYCGGTDRYSNFLRSLVGGYPLRCMIIQIKTPWSLNFDYILLLSTFRDAHCHPFRFYQNSISLANSCSVCSDTSSVLELKCYFCSSGICLGCMQCFTFWFNIFDGNGILYMPFLLQLLAS